MRFKLLFTLLLPALLCSSTLYIALRELLTIKLKEIRGSKTYQPEITEIIWVISSKFQKKKKVIYISYMLCSKHAQCNNNGYATRASDVC